MNESQPRSRSSTLDDYDAAPATAEEAYARLRSWALDCAKDFPLVTADDLHAVTLPAGVDRRLIGNVLKALVRDGVLRPDGYGASLRADCHYRPIVQFRSLLYRAAPVPPEATP